MGNPIRRSLRSRIIERLLFAYKKRSALGNAACADKTLRRRLARGEKPYRLPCRHFRVDVQKKNFSGMDYYILNGRGGDHRHRVLYLHGGAYVNQAVLFHWILLDKLARLTSSEIWAPAYPLAPYHTACDAHALMHKFYDELTASRHEGEELILMGDSAGGGFSLALAMNARDTGKPRPAKIILLSPWLDISMDDAQKMKPLEKADCLLGIEALRKCGELWAGDWDTKDARVSPLYGALHDLGKLSVYTGTHDILNRDARRLKKKLDAQAIAFDFHEEPGLGHVYVAMPIREADASLRAIANDILRASYSNTV